MKDMLATNVRILGRQSIGTAVGARRCRPASPVRGVVRYFELPAGSLPRVSQNAPAANRGRSKAIKHCFQNERMDRC